MLRRLAAFEVASSRYGAASLTFAAMLSASEELVPKSFGSK